MTADDLLSCLLCMGILPPLAPLLTPLLSLLLFLLPIFSSSLPHTTTTMRVRLIQLIHWLLHRIREFISVGSTNSRASDSSLSSPSCASLLVPASPSPLAPTLCMRVPHLPQPRPLHVHGRHLCMFFGSACGRKGPSRTAGQARGPFVFQSRAAIQGTVEDREGRGFGDTFYPPASSSLPLCDTWLRRGKSGNAFGWKKVCRTERSEVLIKTT